MAISKSDSINFPEFINEVGSTAIGVQTFKKMKTLFKIARMAVCKVRAAHGSQGTGAFYEATDHRDWIRFLFITCNHVLPASSFDEISKAILEFEEIEQMKRITLDIKHIKYTWTSASFDATIVEISEELANLYKSFGAKFLKIGKIAAKTEFAMLQYPNGRFSIAHGEIDTISASGRDAFYQIGTAPGSSGSPLLDWNCVALAMHRAGNAGSTGEKPDIWRKAIASSAIIEVYFNEKSIETLYILE